MFLLFTFICEAQYPEIKKSYPAPFQSSFIEFNSPPLRQKAVSFVTQPKQADMRFDPALKRQISRNASERNAEIQSIKAAKDYLKQAPFNANRKGHNDEMGFQSAIEVGTSFYGDIDGSCPNDNTIAVSNNGNIMSMMNNFVGIYKTNGTKINVYTLNDFFNSLIEEDLCDPKVEYDPTADRFFMFIQACNDNPQAIAFGFSKTNNPNGGWSIYLFDSDGLGDGSWSDYPKVAINRDEVFVSLNLFGRGSTGKYKQSIVYQLNKSEGYAGVSLNYKIWSGFQSGTILPIRSGSSNQYGPGVYLVQASAGGADYINFYDITGKLGDPNSKLLYSKLSTTAYEPSGNAYQLGTNVRLDIGDCRLQDGYYLNGLIHFVFAADDAGYSGIRYHRLDPQIMDMNRFEIFSSSDLRDYCYPSISPFSRVSGDHTAIIHFSSSGENHYPDLRAKLFHHDFSSSASVRIKVGPGAHESCFNATNKYARWGDYSGIAMVYNSGVPRVWIAGSVGNDISGSWWTYIAELYAINTHTRNPSLTIESNLFPNPVQDRLTYDIKVDKSIGSRFILKDVNGKIISTIYEGTLLPGENRFSFSTSTLSNGIYFLNIESNKNEIIKTEKILLHR